VAEQTTDSRLADVNEALCGAVENGPWVTISDPALRQIVGEYIADTCHSVASAAGLDEAMELAHGAMPTRLATAGRLVSPDARDRLARHLYLTTSGDHNAQPHWDFGGDQHVNRAPWRAKADAILDVIAGQDANHG
jgi:hypothetical protein